MAFAAALMAAAGCSGRSELLGFKDAPANDAGTLSGDAAPLMTRIVVAADGTGQFLTVQAAIDSIPQGSVAPVEVDIKAGTYNEKVTIANHPFVSLVGDNPLTTVIAYDEDADAASGTGNSATFTVTSSDFSAQNITFFNAAPISGSQAVALFASGDRQEFYNCRFASYQDTVYVSAGTQYFKDCYIQGDDDYILGAATAVFQDCTLYQDSGGVAVVAPSTDETTPYGVVFLGGELTAAADVAAGSVALGRPWRPYGSATYVGTVLGPHISAIGWVPMATNDLTYARFAEYQTTGPGADAAARASGSSQLTPAQAAALTLSGLFGSWVPSFSP